ncbi:Repressor protein CI [Salmonella enterica subsp. enterica serovar Java]|uniref:Repressor protein CI n=2 Tax=Salmonella enterica I TaxID=59201 RepID=A0A5I0Y447_SALET|nr:phage repressor protein CI [Salmonella enterica]EAA3834435.1 Repressor protein CI [Salmonella enterica subsp. enterica serovar Java]EAW1283416.1 Repressor protein CI [Salmonella enterica subsp. enterica]EBS3855501.1 Repressor protein CI [Salmonella enterica subsp. enterica serovar Javiana]EBX4232089.1 Repressor protein CI [Salmonella enterica subsp. enterica serovar Aberdeen]ECB3493121.1 Repressor protein CI [Salmonella enterica subsp. enterica serovar Newport]ECC3893048.1 Repressor protei
MNLETGAREAIERICEAYGFTSRNQLAKHLGITNSSLGNRIMRDNFPADIAIRCSLETGASLQWLVTGEGATFDHAISDTVRVPSFKFEGATLVKSPSLMFDKVMIPDHIGNLEIITEGNVKYLIDRAEYTAADGRYLIEYSGTQSIKELTLLPGNKLRIDWGKYPLDCEIDDVTIIGKVILTMVASA